MSDASVPVTITVLGSGTSVGVPTIGCDCEVCTSQDPRDNRLRPSVHLAYNGRSVVIDTTPDFRQQALRMPISRLDAVILTHGHADHILGLDDVRPFNFHQGTAIPIYANADTLDTIRRCFSYVFADVKHQSSVPKLVTYELNGASFNLFGLDFEPILVKHGRMDVLGFRFGSAAYLTDHLEIPEESLERLHGLDVLFLDALRYKPHPTHATVEQSLAYVERLKPKRAYFTHLSHDLMYTRDGSKLPENVFLAYDGLQIQVGAAN